MRLLNPWALLLLVSLIPIVWIYKKQREKNLRVLLALCCRLAALVLLTLAISGFNINTQGNEVNVIFLVDRSFSVSLPEEEKAVTIIKNILTKMPSSFRAGLVVFGRNSFLDIVPRHNLSNITMSSAIDDTATNIADAMYTALAAFPDHGDRRLVIFSDGKENLGNALRAAEVLKSRGVSIITYPLGSWETKPEVYIRNVITADKIEVNRPHELSIQVHSNLATGGVITFYLDGAYIGETTVLFNPGENSFTYQYVISEPAIHEYEVVISPREDTLIQNNSWTKMINIQGPPSVLVVSPSKEQSRLLINALSAQGFIPEYRKSLPLRMGELLKHKVLILDNLAAYNLSFTQMQLVERWVMNLGGGLLMTGGDESFGVGGYYKTPIERCLPVDMDVNSPRNIPSLAMVVVVDKSTSMSIIVEGNQTKLDLVKEAVFSAVDILNPYYLFGLIGFDIKPQWIIRPTQAGDQEAIREGLASMTAGGGTILYPALKEGYEALKNLNAGVKHLLVLSDGLTSQDEFKELAEQTRKQQITISTIAVGADADTKFMQELASWGGGRSYFTDSFRNLPRIFASESLIISRGLIMEADFFPVLDIHHPIIKGINGFPPLKGFVLTYNKSGAQQILTAFDDAPLLSAWRYGLGKSAAFTSDLQGRWSSAWLKWEKLPQFLAQTLRWLSPPQRGISPFVTVTARGNRGIVEVQVENQQGDYLNDLTLKGVLNSEAGKPHEFALYLEAPGYYQGKVVFSDPDPHFITIYDTEERINRETVPIFRPYSKEFTDFGIDQHFLKRLADDVDMENRDLKSYVLAKGKEFSLTPVWPILVALALLFLLADIALRYFHLPRKSTDQGSRTYEEVILLMEKKRREARHRL